MWRKMPLKEQFLAYNYQEDGACHTTKGHGEVPGPSSDRRKKEELTVQIFIVWQGRQLWASLGLGSLNAFHGLWVIGVVSSCLVSGHRVI